MSNKDLLLAINKVEECSGVKERTERQNITNYLNEYHNWGYGFTRKVEVALDLEKGTLLKMLPVPRSNSQKRIYNEAIKKWRKN